jgi:N utilization substance protein A
MVVSELRGEKIDIIPWNPEPARFIAKALSPARVREVLLDDDAREATVVVPDDQLALAIGKEGLNARLAARLTQWKVDIQSDSEFARAEAEAAFAGAEDDEEMGTGGRCAAMLSNGRRCPNAALPGSAYCGLTPHQALRRFRTNSVTVLAGLSQEEIGRLADASVPDDGVADILAKVSEPEEAAEPVLDDEAADAELEGAAKATAAGDSAAGEAAWGEPEVPPATEAAAEEPEPAPREIGEAEDNGDEPAAFEEGTEALTGAPVEGEARTEDEPSA